MRTILRALKYELMRQKIKTLQFRKDKLAKLESTIRARKIRLQAEIEALQEKYRSR